MGPSEVEGGGEARGGLFGRSAEMPAKLDLYKIVTIKHS